MQRHQQRPRRICPRTESKEFSSGAGLGLRVPLPTDADQRFELRVTLQYLQIWVPAQRSFRPPMAPIDGLLEKTKSSIKIPNQCCQAASPAQGVAPSLGEVYRFPLCEGERVGMAALDVV